MGILGNHFLDHPPEHFVSCLNTMMDDTGAHLTVFPGTSQLHAKILIMGNIEPKKSGGKLPFSAFFTPNQYPKYFKATKNESGSSKGCSERLCLFRFGQNFSPLGIAPVIRLIRCFTCD